MKKRIKRIISILIGIMFFGNNIYMQVTSIPDINFEQALIDLGYDSGIPDGYVTTSNISNIISLDISFKDIQDLTGIEDFIYLEELYCYGNLFYSGIDVSGNNELRILDCNYSGADDLDLSNNVKLTYLNCMWNSQTNLDLSNNPELTDLNCGFSSLTQLDLSHNPKLTTLDCQGNSLVQLDLSSNPELRSLNISSNPIDSVDLSYNIKLTSVDCGYTSVTQIDLSELEYLSSFYCYYSTLENIDLKNNKELKRLDCQYSSITILDLSNNPNLISLNCSNNSISSLNLKNGNNNLIDFLLMDNNPDLSCVVVDNQWYSELNWKGKNFAKDEYAHYTQTSCDSKVSGNIYFDKNENCLKDAGEFNLPDAVIRINDGQSDIYSLSNPEGDFEIWVDTNTNYNVSIEAYRNNELLDTYCPSDGYSINSGPIGTATSDLDFGLNLKECPLVSVDVSIDRLRRCFRNNATITYRNESPVQLLNAEIYVDFPQYVKLVSADEPYTLVDEEKGIFKFSFDTIGEFSSGEIRIIDSVICFNENIRGYTQCIKSWIRPVSRCAEEKDTSGWDKSSIKVLEEVECMGDSVMFTITNKGAGAMGTPREYRIYYDNEIAYVDDFRLDPGDSMKFITPADGSTIRFEADQHPLHPGNSKPRTSVEGCGVVLPEDASLGFRIQSANDDSDPDISEQCLEIIDSYDPNTKMISPSGISSNHYVAENEALKYTIIFQNTGTDTAFNIIVIDSLSEYLDPASISLLGSSYPCDYRISGRNDNLLEFRFKDIMLPDSATDEESSHGFVSFSVRPLYNISPGSIIVNYADIYFDYNSNVRTDTVIVTAKDTIIESRKNITVREINTSDSGGEIVNISTKKNLTGDIFLFPNPTNGNINIRFRNVQKNISVKVLNINGKEIFSGKYENSDQVGLNLNDEPGIYYIKIQTEEGDKRIFNVIKH